MRGSEGWGGQYAWKSRFGRRRGCSLLHDRKSDVHRPSPILEDLFLVAKDDFVRSAFAEIIGALNTAGVRYLVVGGVAVVAHGHPRVTMDLDVVIQLEPENLTRAMDALGTIGYQPLLPVPAAQFADPEIRRDWTTNRDMIVFQFWKPRTPQLRLDVFMSEPFDFEDAWKRRMEAKIGETTVSIVPFAELLAMKREAGRPKDREDIRVLEAIEMMRKGGTHA